MIAIFLILISCAAVWLLIKNSIGSNNSTQPDTTQQTPTRDVSKPKQKEIIVRTLEIPDDDVNGTYVTKIAGITHYCDKTDQGIFQGIIYLDSDNPHNPNAMAIASVESRKIVGYIPENELSKYSRWCNYHNCPCVGFIKQFTNESGKKILFGRVTAIKPCNAKFVKDKTTDTIVWIETTENIRYTGF